MAVDSKTAAAIKVVHAVAETIREAKEVPAGVLYAGLMSQGCSLESFERIVRILINAGVVERPSPNTDGDVLRWIGPAGVP